MTKLKESFLGALIGSLHWWCKALCKVVLNHTFQFSDVQSGWWMTRASISSWGSCVGSLAAWLTCWWKRGRLFLESASAAYCLSLVGVQQTKWNHIRKGQAPHKVHRSIILAPTQINNCDHGCIIANTLNCLSPAVTSPQCTWHDDWEEFLNCNVDSRPGLWPLKLEPFSLRGVCTAPPIARGIRNYNCP